MAKVVVVSRVDTGKEGGGPKRGSRNDGCVEAQPIWDPEGAPKRHSEEGPAMHACPDRELLIVRLLQLLRQCSIMDEHNPLVMGI